LVTLAALADTRGRLRSLLEAAKDLPKTKRHKHRKRRPKRGQTSPKTPCWSLFGTKTATENEKS
jgi:hypothetical protein